MPITFGTSSDPMFSAGLSGMTSISMPATVVFVAFCTNRAGTTVTMLMHCDTQGASCSLPIRARKFPLLQAYTAEPEGMPSFIEPVAVLSVGLATVPNPAVKSAVHMRTMYGVSLRKLSIAMSAISYSSPMFNPSVSVK